MHLRTACLLFGSVMIVSGCAPTAGNKVTGGARVESEAATAAPPSTPARRVYVQDFALDAEATEPQHRAPRAAAAVPGTHRRESADARAADRR